MHFRRKLPKGYGRRRGDIDLVERRLRIAREDYEARYGKEKVKRIANGSFMAPPTCFADLGYPDAGERQTKLRLAYAINRIVEQRKLTQSAAAGAFGREPAKGVGAAPL